MDKDFEVVIVGSDINAYYMARNFYEVYGKKSHLIAKVKQNFTAISKIVDVEYEPKLWDKEVFLKTCIDYAKTQQGKTLILIGTNDFYVRNIIENKEELQKYYKFNYVDLELLNNLALKDLFYTKYENMGVDFPKTYIYDCGKDEGIDKVKLNSLLFPVIVKPGNNVEYYKHEFENQAKVYKLDNEEDVEKIVKKVVESGYTNNLIIQEYIPGDDSKLFDAVIYCNKEGKAQFLTFAQIGLQEHTPTGIGNCTVLINGFNEFGGTDKVVQSLKEFAEKIGYKGAGEFDLKYDERDNKFKVLEINPRQGRSSYYSTACGYNIAEYIVDDLLFNKEKKFEIANKQVVLSFVPTKVIKGKIKNQKYLQKVLELKKNGKLVNPLKYKSDMSIKRRVWLYLRDKNYVKKYNKYEW